MKRKYAKAATIFSSVLAVNLLMPDVTMAQGNSNNAKVRVDTVLDTSSAKCSRKDACGAVSPRQKELLIGICDMLQRRGGVELKADLNKKLKGKTCQQAYANVVTSE